MLIAQKSAAAAAARPVKYGETRQRHELLLLTFFYFFLLLYKLEKASFPFFSPPLPPFPGFHSLIPRDIGVHEQYITQQHREFTVSCTHTRENVSCEVHYFQAMSKDLCSCYCAIFAQNINEAISYT